MKTPFLALFALACTVSLTLAQPSPRPGVDAEEIKWGGNLEEALKAAETDAKPALLFFTTDWHPSGKKMESEVFADANVAASLRECALVRVNLEANERSRALAERLRVERIPALVMLNSKSEVVFLREGWLDADKCAKWLKSAVESFKKHAPLGYKQVQLDKDDPLLQAAAKLPKDKLPDDRGTVVLLDWMRVDLNKDASSRFEVRTGHYVLDSDRAMVNFVTHVYNASRGTARIKAARIVNLDGKGREVDVALAEDERVYSAQSVYWDVKRVTLFTPRLQQGQVLDYVIETENKPVMEGQFDLRWSTATDFMVLSDLTIHFPESLKLSKHPVRCDAEVTETKNADGTVTWRLVTQNLEKVEPEIFEPPRQFTWQGYVFSTTATWDDVANWFRGLCEGRDALPDDAKKKIAELKQAHTGGEALLQAIFDWVTKDIRYVSVSFGLSSHQPHPVADTLKNAYGDCKDQSLLMQALLREAGIPSSLILLGALPSAKFDAPLPGVHHFNHCIIEAQLGEKRIYLDPAGGRAKVGWMPVTNSGAQALRVAPNGGEVITLPDYTPLPDAVSENAFIKVNPDASAVITTHNILRGPLAHQTKQQMREIPVARIRKGLEDQFKRVGQKLLDYQQTNPADESDLYEVRMQFTVARYGTPVGDSFMFFLYDADDDGDWIEQLKPKRTKPLRFTASDTANAVYTLELPEGSVIKTKPDDLELKTEFMEVSRKFKVEGNTLTVTETKRRLTAELPPTEARRVRDTFRKLFDHYKQPVIVKLPKKDDAE
jgi:hypothetical protein